MQYRIFIGKSSSSELSTHFVYLQVVQFLNTLYTVMDERMGQFDVYKVETISDSYLVSNDARTHRDAPPLTPHWFSSF